MRWASSAAKSREINTTIRSMVVGENVNEEIRAKFPRGYVAEARRVL